MCSVDDTAISGEAFIPDEEYVALNCNSKCGKCNINEACIILRKKDLYCPECFLAATTHKVRSALGKSKKMRATDRVLIGFSGGQSSVSLVHMIWAGSQDSHHKKIRFEIICCYIDEGDILNISDEERQNTIAAIENFLKPLNVQLYKTTLSRCFEPTSNGPESEAQKKLLSLFKDVKSLTAKEDLLQRLRHRILLSVAKELNCNKLFTAENQTSLAVKLLTSIAQGRGEQLRVEVGFKDERYPDIILLRPLVEIERKEVAYYNKYHSLPCIPRHSLTSKMPPNASIRKLTEQFVIGLHSSFRSTVSTIYRTGEKLSSSKEPIDADNHCVLCRGSFNVEVSEQYTVTHATNLSREMCRPKEGENCRTKEESSSECCGGTGACQRSELSAAELSKVFCYGCRLILREMDSLDDLPANILDEAKRRTSLSMMRDEIADFLL